MRFRVLTQLVLGVVAVLAMAAVWTSPAPLPEHLTGTAVGVGLWSVFGVLLDWLTQDMVQ